MEITGVVLHNKDPLQPNYTNYTKPEPLSFERILNGEAGRDIASPDYLEEVGAYCHTLGRFAVANNTPLQFEDVAPSMAELNAEKTMAAPLIKQIAMYQEDELLSSPGGDSVYVNADCKIVNSGDEHRGFTERIGKDLNDAKDNLVNMLKDAAYGSGFHYRTRNGEIKVGQRVGFLETIENFFKDLVSGITLGAYTPGTEEEPDGAAETVKHALKKVFVDALYNDVIVGVPRSVGNIAKDAALASLNLAETIPDATIGNSKAGEAVTNKAFDGAQVALEFVTDVLPGGEGRGRVYAFKPGEGIKGLPFIYNLTVPEHDEEGEEIQYVRNTPFRKTIETISSIMPIGAMM